jgi:hypothetical protein
MCDACLLGSRYEFHYECSGCHRLQRIPHPMWQYQASPTEFSSAGWACHQRCRDYTRWRITPEDVVKLPHAHCPDSWGRRDRWLASIREQRLGRASKRTRR